MFLSLVLSVLLCLLAGSAFGQPPVFVSSAHNSSACLSVTTCAVSSYNVGAGNAVVVKIYYSTSASFTVTDTGSANTFACQGINGGACEVGNGSTGFIQWFVAKNTTASATDTITVSSGATSEPRITVIVRQYSNADLTTPVDQAVGSTTSVNSTTYTSPAFTTTSANEMLILGACDSINTFSAGSGYGHLDQSVDGVCASEDQAVTSIQTGATATITVTTTAVFVGSVITIRAPTSGGITAITAHPGGAWTACTGSSPTLNCTVHERQHGFEVNYLQITTTGTYGSTSTSTTGAIGLNPVWCKVNTGDIAACVTPTSSDSTPVLYVGFDGYTDDGLSPGSHSGTVSLNSGAFTINVTIIIAAQVLPTQTTPSGSCAGCTVTDTRYGSLGDTVAITNFVPGVSPGTFQPPASNGGSYTDANFGGVVTALKVPVAPGSTVFNTLCGDALTSCYNSDTSLIMTPQSSGFINFESTVSPFPVLWSGISGGSIKWFSTEPKALVYFSGHDVRKMILGTSGPPGTVFCDQVIATVPGTYTALTDGGDSEITKDDFYFFGTCVGDPSTTCAGQDKKVVLINLGGHPGTCTYSAPFGVFDLSTIANFSTFAARNMSASNIDVNTGLRYLVVQSPSFGGQTGGNEVLTAVGTGTTITDVGPMGANFGIQAIVGGLYSGNGACTAALSAVTNGCLSVAHSGTCEVNGVQGFCNPTNVRQHPFYAIFSFMRFSAGIPGMAIDTSAGGGMTVIQPIKQTGTHSAYARKGNVAVVSYDYQPNGTSLTSWKVTAMSGNGVTPIHVTGDSAYTGANGDVLNFGDVGGNTALNGPHTCTVANLSGSSFDCTGTTGNGTYTASTGLFYKGTQVLTTGPFDDEIQFFNMPALAGADPDVSKMTFLRFAESRSFNFSDAYNDCVSYYWQPHAVIAQDGSQTAWLSHYGYCQFGVYRGLSGFQSTTPGSRGATQAGSVLSAGTAQ